MAAPRRAPLATVHPSPADIPPFIYATFITSEQRAPRPVSRITGAQASLPPTRGTATSCCSQRGGTSRGPAALGWKGGGVVPFPKEATGPGIPGNEKMLVQFWRFELVLFKA